MSATAMKIPLDQIGPEGFDLDTGLARAWLEDTLREARAPFEPHGDGKLVVRLDRMGDVVHVRGKLGISLAAPCGRCLERLVYDLNLPIEVAMFPHGHEPEAGEDGELDDDDLGVTTYDAKEIDLTNIVRDEIFLEMPVNPVCGPEPKDCANQAAVAALKTPEVEIKPKEDPRWAALKNIKLS
jgi:uncharacterized protein